jgi:hypothetical protein
VAFIDHDDVERLGRERGAVCHSLGRRGPAAFEIAGFLVLLGQVGAGQLREDALDGRDDDLCGGVEPRGTEPLDVIEFGEQPPGARRAIRLKLFECLSAQVVAIDQE